MTTLQESFPEQHDALVRMGDAQKLFTRFMEIQRMRKRYGNPTTPMANKTYHEKRFEALFKDGENYGF